MSNPAPIAPRLQAPPGTCDCHIHVYERDYPVAPTAAAPPPEAPLEPYLELRRRLGIARSVVVQPTAYGTDNRCTLKAVAALGDSGRGIVVPDPDVSKTEIDRLTKAGARGVRFHMLAGGCLPWELLEPMAARIAPFGWHVQLQMDGRRIPEREAVLGRLPCPVAIDHVGKFLGPVTLDDPGVRAILRLLERGRTWIKLSGPYEVSRSGPPDYADVAMVAKCLVAAAPERMVWASNWPHPGIPADRMPDDAQLLDLLLDWAPDATTRRRILVDNPAQLYGFPPA